MFARCPRKTTRVPTARTFGLDAEGSVRWRRVTCGVPQGSVLGPTLWNVMFDDVFRLNMPRGVELVGYADDLAVTVTASTITDMRENAYEAIKKIGRWLRNKRLELAAEKTEVVLLTRKRNLPPLTIKVGGTEINPRREIKYLGVWLDSGLTFGIHATKTVEKAGKSSTALGKLMSSIHGPRASKRKVLAGVVHSILLYAAPAWGKALAVERTREKMGRVQRQMAIRVCSAHRTISYEAVMVIAEIPPIDLLAKERLEIYEGTGKQKGREILWRRWQETSKGRRTRHLIPDVRPWAERKHGEVGYYLTQVPFGHGCFVEYLNDIGKAQSRECWFCGEVDNAEHTLFHCRRWGEIRMLGEERLEGPLSRETMIVDMLNSEDKWKIIENIIIRIMSTKEQEEREMVQNP